MSEFKRFLRDLDRRYFDMLMMLLAPLEERFPYIANIMLSVAMIGVGFLIGWLVAAIVYHI